MNLSPAPTIAADTPKVDPSAPAKRTSDAAKVPDWTGQAVATKQSALQQQPTVDVAAQLNKNSTPLLSKPQDNAVRNKKVLERFLAFAPSGMQQKGIDGSGFQTPTMGATAGKPSSLAVRQGDLFGPLGQGSPQRYPVTSNGQQPVPSPGSAPFGHLHRESKEKSGFEAFATNPAPVQLSQTSLENQQKPAFTAIGNQPGSQPNGPLSQAPQGIRQGPLAGFEKHPAPRETLPSTQGFGGVMNKPAPLATQGIAPQKSTNFQKTAFNLGNQQQAKENESAIDQHIAAAPQSFQSIPLDTNGFKESPFGQQFRDFVSGAVRHQVANQATTQQTNETESKEALPGLGSSKFANPNPQIVPTLSNPRPRAKGLGSSVFANPAPVNSSSAANSAPGTFSFSVPGQPIRNTFQSQTVPQVSHQSGLFSSNNSQSKNLIHHPLLL